jgi:hypothetical protein
VAFHAASLATQSGDFYPRGEDNTRVGCGCIIVASHAGDALVSWGLGNIDYTSFGAIGAEEILIPSGGMTLGTAGWNFFGIFLIPVAECLSSFISVT